MLSFRPICAFILLWSLTGCAQSIQDVGDTLHLAWYGTPDVTLSSDDILRIPYASIYARVGSAPQAFLVLAFAENEQLKWVSQDRTMLITQHGRLIKTLGFLNNQSEIHTLEPDPLSQPLSIIEKQKWAWQLTWQEGRQRHTADLTSTFSPQNKVTLNFNGENARYQLINEYVSNGDQHFSNRYWVNIRTGKVEKSQQFIGLGIISVEITQLKSYIL